MTVHMRMHSTPVRWLSFLCVLLRLCVCAMCVCGLRRHGCTVSGKICVHNFTLNTTVGTKLLNEWKEMVWLWASSGAPERDQSNVFYTRAMQFDECEPNAKIHTFHSDESTHIALGLSIQVYRMFRSHCIFRHFRIEEIQDFRTVRVCVCVYVRSRTYQMSAVHTNFSSFSRN